MLLYDMPGQTGMFLALTEAGLDATDALYIDIADYFVGQDQLLAVPEALRVQAWVETVTENYGTADTLLADFEVGSYGPA